MYFRRLKDLREDKDLLQKEVAKKLDISQQYYSQYEMGKYTMPIELLIILSQEYNVSLDYLVGLSDKKNK
jgi:transcriptional regulator with XRE-family HTH domain